MIYVIPLNFVIGSVSPKLIMYSMNEKYSLTGCTADYIYGYYGIGSPHAHLALFNQVVVYDRKLFGLEPSFLKN